MPNRTASTTGRITNPNNVPITLRVILAVDDDTSLVTDDRSVTIPAGSFADVSRSATVFLDPCEIASAWVEIALTAPVLRPVSNGSGNPTQYQEIGVNPGSFPITFT